VTRDRKEAATHDSDDRPDERGTSTEEQDFRATVDSIRVDLGRLTAVENDKRDLDPADPKVDGLSDEAVELADRIAHKTRAERELSSAID
jgi:hypothetical protein